MNKYLFLWLSAAMYLMAPGFLQGQSAVLEGYILEGLNANLSLKTQSLNLAKAQEAVRQSKSLGSPKLTFDANYTVAAGGRKRRAGCSDDLGLTDLTPAERNIGDRVVDDQ